MSTANGTPLRALTPTERKAVELRQRGALDAAIRIETGLTAAQIDVAASRAAAWEELGGKPTAAAVERTDSYRTTNALLGWAEASGMARAMTLAARVREQLAELRRLQEETDARIRAQAEVDRLAAELAAARAKLRGTISARPAGAKRGRGAKPDAARAARLVAIRTWAAEAGYEISPLGRIPRYVELAYDAAHGGEA